MELIKLNEVYNIVDHLENGWDISGQVIKQPAGDIQININVRNDETSIGNYSYVTVPFNDTITISYNSKSELQAAFCDYCESLVVTILEQIKVA